MLTPSTVAYLFASDWAPSPDSQWRVHALGGEVDGFATGASLVAIAIWSMRRQGLIELEQLRPLAPERGMSLGGRSFARMTALESDERPPGIEGRLLEAARDRQRQGFGARLSRLGARVVDRLSGEDEYGVRGAVLGIGMNERHPWGTLVDLCVDELLGAGAATKEGDRVKIDQATLDENRERQEELVRQRAEDREREPELDQAVARDCSAAIRWAFGTPSD